MAKLVAIITGSSRGIGKSTAIEFAKVGVNVVINYKNSYEEAKELEEYIKNEYDVDVLLQKADISNEQDVIEMINNVIDYYGKIDILVNNASIANDSLLLDKTANDFKKVLNTNLVGTFLVSKYVAKHMLENKSGKIINISSTNGIDTLYPESCDYDASKAGVISLTHNFAKELAPYITVNCVAPGWVKTDMNKELTIEQIKEEEKNILLNRFATPKEIAKVIVFLASSKASYINNTVIKVDGGNPNG